MQSLQVDERHLQAFFLGNLIPNQFCKPFR